MDILYEGLIPMIDDLLAVSEDAETVEIADESIFLLMHDNASCQKIQDIADLLREHHIPVMVWPENSLTQPH